MIEPTFKVISDPTSLPEPEFTQFCEVMLEWYKIYHDPIDNPTIELVKSEMKWPSFPETKAISCYGIFENQIVCIARIFLNIGPPNEHLASLKIGVLKEYRKKGIGKKMLNYALEHLPEVVTKVSINFRSDNYHKGSPNWLDHVFERYGGKLSLSDRRSGVNLSTQNAEAVKLKATEHLNRISKNGYRIIFVENYNFPEGFDRDDFVKAMESIWNDMPRDEISALDDILTIDKFEKAVQSWKQQYSSIWMFICLKGSRTIGFTITFIEDLLPTLAVQDDTGVIEEHRGQGLGIALKYQMLDKLLNDPSANNVSHWVTHNAHSNTHMIRINTELDYKEIATFNNYEFDIKDLKNLKR